MGTNRIEEIRARLTAAFAPRELEIFDDSERHKGHAGARDGRGHFRVIITSSVFAGRTPTERHRMVFQALTPMLQTDIHALSISARSTDDEPSN
jgi:BolA protein